jgi:hypothetical protein
MPVTPTSASPLFAYRQATRHIGAKQKAVLDTQRFFPDATNAELGVKLASLTIGPNDSYSLRRTS